MSAVAPEEEWPYEVLTETLHTAAVSMARIGAAYMEVASEDTSPDQRRRLAEAARLLGQALDLFR